VGDKGLIKISGFHCARSPWCKRPLSDEVYENKVPIPAPELIQSMRTFPSDVWAYGLFIYAVATVGEQPVTSLEQVLKLSHTNDLQDLLGSFVDTITLCLQKDPIARPTFQELRNQVSVKAGSSTPSCSSHSLEDPLNAQIPMEEAFPVPTLNSSTKRNRESTLVFQDESMDWDSSDITASYSTEELRQRLKNAELEALKAKALQKRAEAAKDTILDQVQVAEAKCLREVEMITKTFLMRLNEANDRAAEAEQARYLAEEVKRLTEEKYTLYKYESEKNMHDLKSMFDDALLERDELIAALKTVGKDFDATEWISPKRRDSIRQLEDKYQRYISTSDRTIQSLKTQLNSVVKQRDQLASDREAGRNEMKDTREALGQAVKEKEEFQFRLEEAQFEIERLEEMISTMTQKRQQAERERDQLQMLTDMSLMKLRQAESGVPKKRASVGSLPSRMEERPQEKRDPNLRRLSEQLFHLIGPSPKSGENGIGENTSSAEILEEVYEKPSKELSQGRSDEVAMPVLRDLNGNKEKRQGNETHNNGNAWKTTTSSSPRKFVYINYVQSTDKEVEQSGHKHMTSSRKTPTSQRHEVNDKDTLAGSADQSRKGGKHFTIPTLHIEEAETDSEIEHPKAPPEIEISDVDEQELIAQEEEEESAYQNSPDPPMFIVEGEDGDTRIVYSFDDLPELLEGIPQTSL